MSSQNRRGRRNKGRGRGKGKGKRKSNTSSSAKSSSSNLLSKNKDNNNNNKSQQESQENEMEIFVGLDVGSSFIKIAVIQNNINNKLTSLNELSSLFMNESTNFHSKINFLADDSGERCIPSVITILDSSHHENEILIGKEAVKSSVRNYKNCIYHSKYLNSFTQIDDKLNIDLFQSNYNEWKSNVSKFGMHKSILRPIFDDDDNDNNDKNDDQKSSFLKLKYQIKKVDNNQLKQFLIDNAFIKLMKKIFNVISSQTGSTKINVVSSVPFYYTEKQINNYKSLLSKSGFKPLQIIYDHSASLLALNFDNKSNKEENILCIDFGTFSSTFSVVKVLNGLISSSSNNDNYYHKSTEISGIKLDQCILKWLIKDFENRNKGCYIEIENAKSRLKLLTEITRIKQVLSSGSNQVRFDIESLYDGIDYHFQLSKPKFESIIYDNLNSIKNWINQQLTHCNKINKSINYVIISGGLYEIPKLQNILQNIFGDKLLTKQLLTKKGISANFIHSYGCAIQAASLSYIYQFQNQVSNGYQSLTKVIQLNNEKNDILSKNEQVLFTSKQINIHYILGRERKQFYILKKNTMLPFETKYKIQQNEVQSLLNDNNEISNDLDYDISFTIDIIDDDEKSIIDTMEQSINSCSIKSKRRTKEISIEISLDPNYDLHIIVGKDKKCTFELENQNENDSDIDNDNDDTDIKTETIDNDNDDTVDID